MYLLPEAEQANLKHPIAPHPALPTQFHTPQGLFNIYFKIYFNYFRSYKDSKITFCDS